MGLNLRAVTAVTATMSLLAPFEARGDDDLPTLAEIRETIAANFDRLETFQYSLDVYRGVRVERGEDGNVAIAQDPTVSSSIVFRNRRAFTRDGREYRATDAGRPIEVLESPGEIHSESAYDGKFMRSVGWNPTPHKPGESERLGKIESGAQAGRKIAYDATLMGEMERAWGLNYNTKRMDEWMDESIATVAGRASVKGSDTVFVDVRVPEMVAQDGRPLVTRVYFDPNRGFAVTQIDSMIGDEISFQITNLEMVEILPGFWLPTSGTVLPPQGAKRFSGSYFTVLDYRVNEPIPDERFEVHFQPGDKIWDRVADRRYVYGAPVSKTDISQTERTVDLAVELSQPARDEPRQPPPLPTRRAGSEPPQVARGPVRIDAVLSLLLVGAALSFVVFRRRKALKRAP